MDNIINIWDCQTGQKVRSTSLNAGENWTVSFLPDARYVATGSSTGTVNLLSVASGKIESSLDTQDKKFIYSVNFVIINLIDLICLNFSRISDLTRYGSSLDFPRNLTFNWAELSFHKKKLALSQPWLFKLV